MFLGHASGEAKLPQERVCGNARLSSVQHMIWAAQKVCCSSCRERKTPSVVHCASLLHAYAEVSHHCCPAGDGAGGSFLPAAFFAVEVVIQSNRNSISS